MKSINERLDALEAAVFGVEVVRGDLPVPISIPNRADTPDYRFSPQGMLAGGRNIGTAYVEPVVDRDCPLTVFLPITGNVLSVPRIDLVENIIGYMMRVFDQAHAQPHQWGSIAGAMLDMRALPGFKHHDSTTWPEAVDRFYNKRAYMTFAERVQDNAITAAGAPSRER